MSFMVVRREWRNGIHGLLIKEERKLINHAYSLTHQQ